ncbi:bifunctional diguanylate cyclase/phosphodiesterase [Pseudomonas sp. Gutcm_11s]|uniref:bifunctional diguanylate cyclase/phosphodiesterase n=1 Tax=Pseudomonas sp. Gutcm_11s TaxID=3026088 RepID=UPI0023610B3C|nr:EAL domain-containing protein [Pseudomonas sp. Gutcm_11s]MDD0841743.1 EAL domain-containing protein [Pseudomonas sp. Gutcm_11s]
MPNSFQLQLHPQHGLRRRRIGLSFFVSMALALLLAVGFSGWSILRDYQASTDQHRHNMMALSRALEGYTSALLQQSYESVRVSFEELNEPRVTSQERDRILQVLQDAMRYDPVSSHLFALIDGQIFIVDAAGRAVHNPTLKRQLAALTEGVHEEPLYPPLRNPDRDGFLLPLMISPQTGSEQPLQLGALIPTERFGYLLERLGLEQEMNGGLISAWGTILYRMPQPETYTNRELPEQSPLRQLGTRSTASFVEADSLAGVPTYYVLTPSPRFPLYAVIGETRSSFHGPWLRRSGLTLVLLAASLLLLGLAALQLRRLIGQVSQDEEFYRRLFTDVNDGLLLVDREGTILTANPVSARLFGLEGAEQLRGRKPALMAPERQLDGRLSVVAANLMRHAALEGEDQQFEWRFLRQDSAGHFDCELRVSQFHWRGETLLLGVLHDITERKRYLAEQEFLATHDSLTQLPNRYWLVRHIDERAALDKGQHFAVLLLDMNRFKEVNDTLGHQHGDRVLTELGERLQEWLAEQNACVARLGGDEMAIVSAHLIDQAALHGLCSGVAQVIARPLLVDGIHLELTASIGIAMFPEHGMSASDLLRCADIAMYQAKRERREYALYQRSTDNYTPERLALHTQLGRAIREGGLQLYYQPKIRLSDRQVVGFEALLRWQHPEKGMIPPGDFIPLAESTELIHPLTRWVLNEALRQLRQWQDQGLGTCLAVNISTHNLLNPHFLPELAELLAHHRVAAELLELEVTEGTLMEDPELALRSLQAIRELGVNLSIDDFGTGYSSLAYLKRLPVQVLKIDRTFVSAMTENASDAVIVQSTLALAHNFAMQVVAEGVEDEDTAAALTRQGCDIAQGYHFGRPMPAGDLEHWRSTRLPT